MEKTIQVQVSGLAEYPWMVARCVDGVWIPFDHHVMINELQKTIDEAGAPLADGTEPLLVRYFFQNKEHRAEDANVCPECKALLIDALKVGNVRLVNEGNENG